MRCALYISSRRDFSHAARRNAAVHESSACVDGHANRIRFDPAVLSVRTLVYFFAGEVGVSGIVTEPSTWMNLRNTEGFSI